MRRKLTVAAALVLVAACGEVAMVADPAAEEAGAPDATAPEDSSVPVADAVADAVVDAGLDVVDSGPDVQAPPPDPRAILFLSRDDFRLWRVQPDGGNPTPISEVATLGGVWILKRERVAYWSTATAAGEVRTMLPDGGDNVLVTIGRGPQWDEHGQRIVFRRDRDLYRVHVDGGGEERLTYDNTLSTGTQGYVSPDGTQLLISNGSNGYCIAKNEADAGRACAATCVGPFSWHPDGKRILCRRPFNNFDCRIVVVDLVAGTDVELTNGSFFDFIPAWSPDGKQIVFSRGLGPANTGAELHVMNADGTGIVKITTGLGAQEPDWR